MLQIRIYRFWIYLILVSFDHYSKAQAVKVCIALAVFCTFGLQFFVCLEIGWDSIKDNFTQRPTLVNYVMRTVLVAAAVLLAVAVPTISPFIGLIGAFCFSILGLLIPVSILFCVHFVVAEASYIIFFLILLKVIIEMVTYWDSGFGPLNWIIWKNVIVCIFGILALVFGSKSSIEEIILMYAPTPTNTTIVEMITNYNTSS